MPSMLSRCERPGVLSSLMNRARLLSPLLEVTSLEDVVGLPILGIRSLRGPMTSIGIDDTGSAMLKDSGNSAITCRLRAIAPQRRKA
jgi:hypothetical protein